MIQRSNLVTDHLKVCFEHVKSIRQRRELSLMCSPLSLDAYKQSCVWVLSYQPSVDPQGVCV